MPMTLSRRRVLSAIGTVRLWMPSSSTRCCSRSPMWPPIGYTAVTPVPNRFITRVRPWELAKAERDGDAAAGLRLDAALCQLTGACSALGRELAPFLPDAAARITARLTPAGGRLPEPSPVFRRLSRPARVPAGCGSAG